MKAARLNKFTSLLMLMLFFSIGCMGLPHYNLKVQNDLDFQNRSKKKSGSIGIYLDRKTRNYTIDLKQDPRYTLRIGKSLAANSVRSLKKVYSRAYIVKSPSSTKNVIAITFGRWTTLNPGKTTISSNIGRVELNCRLLRSGRTVWKTRIKKECSRGNPLGFCSVCLPLGGKIRSNKAEALGGAAHDSIEEALEELNKRLIAR